MRRVGNCSVQQFRVGLYGEGIAALFRPVFGEVPASAKARIGRAGILQLRPQSGETQQIQEAMAVHVTHGLRSRRKMVLLYLPADAGLQGTLHCVAGQVVSPF